MSAVEYVRWKKSSSDLDRLAANRMAVWLSITATVCALMARAQVGMSDESKLTGDESNRDRVTVVYQTLDSIDPAKINADLKPGNPTVDVGIYLGEAEEETHGYAESPGDLVASFKRAKEIFAEAGVQLKLLWVKRATVPPDWLTIQANDFTGDPVPPEINAYVGYRSAGWSLTSEAKAAFEGIIEQQPENHRTIYLLYLKQVRMAYYDRSEEGPPQFKTLKTSGLSLPTYLFETRMPRRIRGAITLTRNSGRGGRTVAHELGHKLINVSHEYRDISPQFEVRGDGGLMIYGPGTEIPGGEAGRWHRERLHLSPFIYRTGADGTRRWNADYVETGHYYDPLYGDSVIRFGVMKMPLAK